MYLMMLGAISISSLLFISCKQEGNKVDQNESLNLPESDPHTMVLSDDSLGIKAYIDGGGDLNVRDRFGGSSPLISAAVFGKTRMAEMLLKAGADINFQNNDGSTALHTAAFFCRPDIVQLLLDNNADTTIKNKYGATAYDNVSGSFDDVKEAYDMMGQALGPMGLQLDYEYIKSERPVIAEMLQK